MSSPSSRNPRWGGARKQSTEQQRCVRIWAELHGAAIHRLHEEGNDLVGEVELEGVRTPFRLPVERPFGWRGRTRTRTAIDRTIHHVKEAS